MKGTVVVMYPRSYLWIGIGGMIFYGGVLLLMALSRAMGNETATWPVFVVFGGLCSLSVLLVVGASPKLLMASRSSLATSGDTCRRPLFLPPCEGR